MNSCPEHGSHHNLTTGSASHAATALSVIPGQGDKHHRQKGAEHRNTSKSTSQEQCSYEVHPLPHHQGHISHQNVCPEQPKRPPHLAVHCSQPSCGARPEGRGSRPTHISTAQTVLISSFYIN